MLDVQKIKKDFPVLSQQINGRSLVFLDSAASSQKPRAMIDAISNYYSTQHANIHRGAYELSVKATDLYERTRTRIHEYLQLSDEYQVIYTRNTTEAINLVAQAVVGDQVHADDEIIVSEIEHHSNLLPWQTLAKNKQAKLRFIALNEVGEYQVESIKPWLQTGKVKVLAMQHVSNCQGVRQPIEEIMRLVKSTNQSILSIVDGAQGIPHDVVKISDWGVDFYAFSAHKLLGPTGLGVLVGRKSLLEHAKPFMTGGGMILSADKDNFTAAGLPEKFEAGTPSIAAVVAFHASLEYLANLDLMEIIQHEQNLVAETCKRLRELGNVHVYQPVDSNTQAGIVSFNIAGVHPHDVGSVLDAEGVAVRAGHHCCEPWMRRNKISGSVRASFYIYNDEQDIDRFISGVQRTQKIFAK